MVSQTLIAAILRERKRQEECAAAERKQTEERTRRFLAILREQGMATASQTAVKEVDATVWEDDDGPAPARLPDNAVVPPAKRKRGRPRKEAR